MKAHTSPLRVLVLLSLCLAALAYIPCSNPSSCTANTTNAFCASQGYCSCQPGWIFSCQTQATYASSSGYLIPLTSIRPYYYILGSQTGGELEYTITFSDPNVIYVSNLYQPNIYTDMGMGIPPQTTYSNVLCSERPYYFSCTFSITLSNMPDTQQPQNLILFINMSSPVSPSLSFSYSFSSKTSGTPIFLILGYVAGGLLIFISMILIVLVYRKKRHQNPRQGERKAEPVVFDITHFQEFMPAQLISIQDKKNMQTCSVCLQEFDFNGTIRKTICQHVFHTVCLDEWCIKNLSCPMCRTELSRQNISQLHSEKSKKDNQTDWIVNSLHEEEEPSEIRNPLNGSNVLDNNDL